MLIEERNQARAKPKDKGEGVGGEGLIRHLKNLLKVSSAARVLSKDDAPSRDERIHYFSGHGSLIQLPPGNSIAPQAKAAERNVVGKNL